MEKFLVTRKNCAQVSDNYIRFSSIYTIDHIFSVIPIKHLVNQDGEPTKPQILATGTKHSVSDLNVLFFPCVLEKATAHVDTKALIMHHYKEVIVASSVESHNTRKGYLIYVPITRKYFLHMTLYSTTQSSSTLACTWHTCSEVLAMQPSVSYIPYATSSHEQNVNIINFAQFKEGNLV